MAYDMKKLENFKRVILDNVDKKVKEIKAKAIAYREEHINNTKQKELDKIFIYMQSEIKKLKENYRKKIKNKKLEHRKNLILIRNHMVEKILSECEQKLLKFSKSSEYRQYLINSLSKSFSTNTNEKITIKIRDSDYEFKDDILKINKNFEVKADPKNKLGGFKAISSAGYAIDKTLYSTLYDKKYLIYKIPELNLN